jgi:hypothetical protein
MCDVNREGGFELEFASGTFFSIACCRFSLNEKGVEMDFRRGG